MQIIILQSLSLIGNTIQLTMGDDADVIDHWTSANDYVRWEFKVIKQGSFKLFINYDVPGGGGGNYGVFLDGNSVKAVPTRSGKNVRDEHMLVIEKAGPHTLEIRGEDIKSPGLMILKSARLVPVAGT